MVIRSLFKKYLTIIPILIAEMKNIFKLTLISTQIEYNYSFLFFKYCSKINARRRWFRLRFYKKIKHIFIRMKTTGKENWFHLILIFIYLMVHVVAEKVVYNVQ